jgi:hypothetical protein
MYVLMRVTTATCNEPVPTGGRVIVAAVVVDEPAEAAAEPELSPGIRVGQLTWGDVDCSQGSCRLQQECRNGERGGGSLFVLDGRDLGGGPNRKPKQDDD